jgi:superfamily II DNA or RNA helicase
MQLQLRAYQREAIDDTRKRWAAGAMRVPLVLATGLGKSVIAASLISEWARDNPGKRALVIAHTDELIDQLYRKILDVAPHLRTGIVKGAKNQLLANVIVSSRQTLAHARRRVGIRDVGLIVIDEAHHAVKSNSYGTILEHFGGFDPDSGVKAAGFTATLVRGDKQKLSSVWEDCSFARDIRFGIRNGYLLDIQGARIVVPGMDASSVARRGGDYDAAALAEELDRTFAIETIAKQYLEIAADRKTIAFWPLVATAEHAAEVFNDHGIPSGHVSGVMDKTLRRQTLADLRSGKLACVHNAMVLTEGFDDPSVDCVLVGRRTVSPVMGPQMAGRGMRPPLWIPSAQRRPMLLIDAVGAFDEGTLKLLIDLSPERVRAAESMNLDDDSTLTFEERETLIDEALAADAEERRAGASFAFESDEYRGATSVVTFDPLGRDAVWAVTPAGTHYVKAGGDAYVFVVPSLMGDPSTFDVVACSKRDSVRAPGWQRGTVHTNVSFELALGWAEAEALEIGGYGAKTLGARKSKWRRGAPSDAAKRTAVSLGAWHDGMNAGECSDAIDAVYAARRIDPLVARVLSRVP